MTFGELREVAASVHLRGLLTGWRIEASRHSSADVIEFLLSGPAPDADHADGRMTKIYFVETIPEEVVKTFETRDVLSLLRGAVHRLMSHEADEAFVVSGERPFNPHRGDPQLPKT